MSSPKDCGECKNDVKAVQCKTLIGKLIMSTVLLYMLYIGVTCPCKPLYDCHITQLYVSVGIVLAVLIYFNGMRLVPLKNNPSH